MTGTEAADRAIRRAMQAALDGKPLDAYATPHETALALGSYRTPRPPKRPRSRAPRKAL